MATARHRHPKPGRPWNYCSSTADFEFTSCYAAEVLLEIARF